MAVRNHQTTTRSVDKKGRLLLGLEMAGATVLVEKMPTGEFIVRPAVTVPAEEAWLFQNKEALESVRLGLEDARSGRFVKDPRGSKRSPTKRTKG